MEEMLVSEDEIEENYLYFVLLGLLVALFLSTENYIISTKQKIT